MEVTVAKSAGFCFGVKRAVNMVYEQISSAETPIYTYGPIIHNTEVTRDFASRGVTVINSPAELRLAEKGTIIIRSHGITRAEEEEMRSLGFDVKDATCPFVKKIHRLVEQYSREGYRVLISGDPRHPEVLGIKGWAANDNVRVITSPEELMEEGANYRGKMCLVSQTTFNLNKFNNFVEIILEKGYDILVMNTICDATEKRQREAQELASKSDAMIVIGDRHSSNTQKLFDISKKECLNTYYIQTSSEMDYSNLSSLEKVGITAGASTPQNIIEEVSKYVRTEL